MSVHTIDPDAVAAALDRVVDPCSNALGEPLGLREMGLATVVGIDDTVGEVTVTMRLTSPCCAYGPTMALAAERELRGVAGVTSASVTIDHGAVWTTDEILPEASVRLTDRRVRTLAVADHRPYDWSTWTAPGSHPTGATRRSS